MRALVLWADDRSSNLGVRALGEGAHALLQQAWPEVQVEFQSFGRGPAPLPIQGARSLVRERITGRFGLQKWLSGFDVVLDMRAGDSFTDAYGAARLTTMSTLAECATQAGTPVVLGPQTIGPFSTARGRAIGRWSLRRARLVMARDSVSAAHAVELGRAVDALSTDVVFALPVPQTPRTRDVLLNISGLLWQPGPHVDAERYRSTVADLYRSLTAGGRRVDLMAHVLPSSSPDDDVPAIDEFRSTIAPDAQALIPGSLTEARELVASAELVIGSRMHACLNALSVGTPAIPLAYSRKFAPLLDDLGWHHTVDLRVDTDAATSALRLTDRDDLDDGAASVRDRAQVLLRPAVEALRGLG
ncbi:polysaccharide pyruvyl transferase family protein [Actinotalea sp. K2]|uniref:polysaccharide pyruvyl transferase family protein n=1 Tax=Actinotalea sp. K2 TaxID=2939438 RepID=UPI002017E2CE|nr:polysaccharide pyruvyl transferase family protein [Actinotalea sp. K2]MCL3861283.1 polysaccharide pyruvyl transferase family protein [Actinotalea sp. K2]